MSEDIITNRQLQRACSHPEPTTDSGGLTSGATRGGSPGVGVGSPMETASLASLSPHLVSDDT